MAKDQFSDLSPAEHELFQKAPYGEEVTYGAKITGQLNLACIDIPFNIGLYSCSIPHVILLRDANIQGLNLKGSHIGGLYADRAVINKSLFLRQCFFSMGEVRIVGANIKGNLSCRGGRFNNENGKAICAERAVIGGSLFMNNGFHAQGEVDLLGVSIGGNLTCTGGQFDNPEGQAINADSLKVHGDTFLRNEFRAQGTLNFTRAHLMGSLQYHTVAKPKQAILDLEHADIGVLWDEEASWPSRESLYLHGLTYNEIHHTSPHDAASRKRWLGLQPNGAHTPQPYEQLAIALRKAGKEQDAREILIEKNRRLKQFDNCLKDWSCLVHWLFGLFLGYGYKPRNALWWILGFIMLGTIVFHVAGRDGLMVQAQSWNIRHKQALQATMVGEPYPRFNALVYSIDTFVPFIDLDQEDYWIPASNGGTGTFSLCEASLEPGHHAVADLDNISFGPTFLYIYFWCHVCIGWFFTGLLIIGVTGMLQRRSE